MKKITIILLNLFFYSNIIAQTQENNTNKINHLYNYTPSSLNTKNYVSDLETKYKIKINKINSLLAFGVAYTELKLNDNEFLTMEKHIDQLANELYNDGIQLLLKGVWAHGGTYFSSEIIKGKKIEVLVFCYGNIIKDNKVISRIFEKFNQKMKEKIVTNVLQQKL
ncbi:hypothetical protein [uncultured Tenacibaculum sp.]|uniref:hypothetical protein n=1 Tax=uncultured Tenacibaculum sp. TaxID=174713 RepID=UPI002620ADC7|nr:hypothetical protein [uncultured Tenacibaculum sp.]